MEAAREAPPPRKLTTRAVANEPPPPLAPPARGIPVGARLLEFAPRWRLHFPQDPWIIQAVSEGVRISFTNPPPLTRTPLWTDIPTLTEKRIALQKEVETLLAKKATELVKSPNSPAFYSRLFLVPKPGGRWRPVIDLSALNKFIRAPRFRMETAKNLRNAIEVGDWAVSLDLSDAYLHVPMHPASRRYLRFAFQGNVYQFRALPFGLNLSPWVFTRLMDAVMAKARQASLSPSSNYLDDLLLRNQDQSRLQVDRDALLNLLIELGFIVNMEKSDLTPQRSFIHLGMQFQTQENLVRLPEKRIVSILECVQSTLDNRDSSARHWLRLLGLANAAAELIPQGRLFLRPLQLYLMALWRPATDSLEARIPRRQHIIPHLQRWRDRKWLEEGVPLQLPNPTLSLCTDASVAGWGAHLLPSFDECSGVWSQSLSTWHINMLEMQAVWEALLHWEEKCSSQQVLVLSDNTTVVAYIQKSGGTKSVQLCMLAFQLLRWCAERGIRLRARHIPGRLNVLADALSRRGQMLHTEWSMHPVTFNWICSLWERPQIDLFATRWNNKLQVFVSPVPDPSAWAVDALSIQWDGLIAYAFPPTILVPKLIPKIRGKQTVVILVAPFSWNRVWTTDLLSLATHPPVPIPLRPTLLKQPRQDLFHPCPERLALHVWRLSGLPSRTEISRVKQWRLSLKPEEHQRSPFTRGNGASSASGVGGRS